mgnify:CR=1 FL=1
MASIPTPTLTPMSARRSASGTSSDAASGDAGSSGSSAQGVASGGATAAPCGTWESPLTPASLVVGAAGISESVPDADGSIWWAESRPENGGRIALVRHRAGETVEITPDDANVRSRVHEYGGGAWWAADGIAWYVDNSDQRLRKLVPGESPVMLSPPSTARESCRYADCRPAPCGRWLIGVSEVHREGDAAAEDAAGEPLNRLVAVATDGSMRVVVLVEGADFYGSPRISPDGRELAWIEWQHPHMPWDETRLCRARLRLGETDARVESVREIAGGAGSDEAIVQPEWSPDGHLHFLSDRNDTWQLYREGVAEATLTVSGEIGYPPWVFGLSRYAFRADGTIVAARFNGGIEFLDGHEGFTAFHTIRTAGDHLGFVGASWESESVVVLDGKFVSARRELGLDPAFLAPPERLHFPSADNEHAYALYFAPANPAHAVPEGERPPLVVLAHGGPTSAARSQLNLAQRFWTSRGFAVADVNYRGSSGFGRRYRKKLDGQWGIADVEDCVACAEFLVARGDVDPERLIIRGGSAGGFTVLSALAFHDTFTAGASLYGVADLEALASDTHKFESRYLDSLIGPYPACQELYRERSPIHHLEGFTAPMIVLQGSEDRIVPPNQSRMIVEALEERGVPVAYLEFAGEQHGFRQAATLIRALEAELAFYGRVFGFRPAGPEVELEIRVSRNQT